MFAQLGVKNNTFDSAVLLLCVMHVRTAHSTQKSIITASLEACIFAV